MSKYMPPLEQPLASDRGAGGESLTDGERAYYTEIPDTSSSNTTSRTSSWVTQALESLSQQAHATERQGLTQDQFQKSVDLAKVRAQMAGTDETRGGYFDQYFVAPGAVRTLRIIAPPGLPRRRCSG